MIQAFTTDKQWADSMQNQGQVSTKQIDSTSDKVEPPISRPLTDSEKPEQSLPA